MELDNGEMWQLEPFQLAFVRDVFRGFRVCWLVVPEGNGKTTLLAGLALYHIEHTPSGYVAVAASSRDQAEWVYRQAAGFVARSGREDFRCLEGYRRIRYDRLHSRIQVFAADDRSGDGAIASLFILDELHRHRDLALYRTWSGKLRKRDGQLLAISTAGEVGSEFELERDRFRQSGRPALRRKGFLRVQTENAVMHEWALNQGSDPERLELVKQANPFSGVTLGSLREKRDLPGMTVAHWLRFSCNLASRSELAAITEREWARAYTEQTIPQGEEASLGLDVAWKWDTTAIVPLHMPDLDTRLFGRPAVLEPPRDGTSLDPELIKQALRAFAGRYRLDMVVMDTSRAEDLAAWILGELDVPVLDRAQTNTQACLDYERFMEGLRSGRIRHPGDPVFTRHVLAAVARTLPGGDTRFWRPPVGHSRGPQHDRNVIDALTAAAMVHSQRVAALSEPPPASPPRVINLGEL